MAVCRVTVCLAKSLVTHFGSRIAITGSPALDATRDALNKLYELLLSHATSISIYVQTSVGLTISLSYLGAQSHGVVGELAY